MTGSTGDAPASERPISADGDRPQRHWRDRGGDDGGRRDRGERNDRGERHDRGERPRHDAAADSTAATTGEALPAISTTAAPAADVSAPTGEREHRHDRPRDRDRDRNRGGRDGRDGRDGEHRHADAAPAAEAPVAAPAAKVDAPATAAPDRGRDRKRGARTEPVAETREFWETWADEKQQREPVAAAPVAKADDADAPAVKADEPRGRERGGRGRGRDRDDKHEKTVKADDKTADAPKPERSDRGGRGKRDDKPAAAAAPAAAGDAGNARLFVSLGKKHGVSADDLRSLLAAGGDKARIGSVMLRDSHAHVRVPEDQADKIIAAVHGTKHNEHDVTVERARA